MGLLPLVLSACTLIGNGNPAPRSPESVQTRCATATVVGLAWTPAAGAPPPTGYRVFRDGALIATTSTPEYADTSVTATTHYDYGVAAFDGRGRSSASAALAVTTAAGSPDGDAAYCPSRTIASMRWHWSEGYTESDGSDLWPATWGSDGSVYLAFGDGGGFGGNDFLGRASFGIARVSGPPSPASATLTNVYGGYRSLHPASLSGKASSILAVGKNFYALGGIYGPGDTVAQYPSFPSGSPNRVQLAYSLGNAYSWRAARWSFCGADARGKGALVGSFCPMSFINFGPGNSGAPGGFVYLLGTLNSTYVWSGGIAPVPLNTYLARVSKRRILHREDYRYFAGRDPRGRPTWSADPTRMQPIFSDHSAAQPGCNGRCNMAEALGEVVYDAGLKRYLGVAQGDYLAQSAFYEAPAPWGPWAVVDYANIDAGTGTGGWAQLGTAAGGSLGVHPVNAWSSADGRTLWFTFSSNGKAPPGSLFPPPGTAMDAFNLVSATLQPTE